MVTLSTRRIPKRSGDQTTVKHYGDNIIDSDVDGSSTLQVANIFDREHYMLLV